jgi:hypothetical protein
MSVLLPLNDPKLNYMQQPLVNPATPVQSISSEQVSGKMFF